MDGLHVIMLYALPVACLLIFIILTLSDYVYFPFIVNGQTNMSQNVTQPHRPPSVSQGNATNLNQTLNNSTNLSSSADDTTIGIAGSDDIFGTTKIYPTKLGGREWFLNMSDPKNSSNFFITGNLNLSKVSDGAWRVNASHVRMVVNSTGSQEKWKNVEVTGYVRLSDLLVNQQNLTQGISGTSSASNSTRSDELEEDEIDDLVFISRSGRHSSEVPCEGTAYNAGLHTDGSVGWKKEIWHTGGYTEERARHKVAESYLNKWVGLKAVVYNIIMKENETGAVKLETYIDSSNTNKWTKVSDIIDSGGWYTKSGNTEFFSAGCGRARDYIITDGGPNVIFRTDDTLLDFKDLSVREIQPPLLQAVNNANLSSVLRFE